MFRNTVLALAATVAIGVGALTPTAASASHPQWRHGGSHNWHHNWYPRSHRSGVSVRFYKAYAFAPRCHTTRRWVDTRWGWRLRTIRVCR